MSKQRFLTTNDVFVKTDTNQSVSDALAKYERRLARLESNTKWLYKYGGIGSGGGSGSGSSANTSFTATVFETTNNRQLAEYPYSNTISFKTPGEYSFKVQIYKGNGQFFEVKWSSPTISNTKILTAEDSYEWIFNIPCTENGNYNIQIKNISNPDDDILSYNADITVYPYSFKIYYVEDNPQHTLCRIYNNNIYMSDFNKSGIKVALDYTINTTLQKVSYTYTDWNNVVHKINKDSDNDKQIQSNAKGTIYLDLVEDIDDGNNIKTYLQNENNAATKTFNIDITMTIDGVEEYVTKSLVDTIIPSDVFLKVIDTTEIGQLYPNEPTSNDFKFHKITNKHISEQEATPDDIAEAGKDNLILTLGYTSDSYLVEAAEGIIINESGSYYKVQNSKWIQLDPEVDNVDNAIEAVSHGQNFYAKSLDDNDNGKIIYYLQNIYSNSYIAGAATSIEITPFYGALGVSKKNFNFQLKIDDWPVTLNNAKILSEQTTVIINPLIMNDHKLLHKFEFILEYAPEHKTIVQTYYAGVKYPKSLDWYAEHIQNKNNNGLYTSYYRFAQGSSNLTLSRKLVDPNEIISQNLVENKSLTYVFSNNIDNNTSTYRVAQEYDQVFSIGIQYSNINSDENKIFSITTNGADIEFYPTKIIVKKENYTNNDDTTIKTFFINKENDINISDLSKYHLITIVNRIERSAIAKTTGPCKSFNVYIDGILSHVLTNFLNLACFQKVVLYPGNYYVNLIEAAMIANPISQDSNNNDIYYSLLDPVHYFYAYSEKILKYNANDSDDERNSKINLFDSFYSNMEVTKTNHVKIKNPTTFFENVTSKINMPILRLHCNTKYTDGENNDELIDAIQRPYLEDEITVSHYSSDSVGLGFLNTITIEWSPGGANSSLQQINSPNGGVQTFHAELQGSSTLKYRCKNFELYCSDRKYNDEYNYEVFSPNFEKDNPNSFLPERSFTLKADAVDSSHSNNNTMGTFINNVMTPFTNALNQAAPTTNSSMRQYIKTCLTGFPVLLFLTTTDQNKTSNTYFFGIYNFNMGRKSYFNLGYSNVEVFSDNGNDPNAILLKNGFNVYTIPKTSTALLNTLGVAEIQGNSNYYDFSQYNPHILFPCQNGDTTRMFDDFVTTDKANLTATNGIIPTFVKSIAYAGGYIFEQVGKTFSINGNSNDFYGYADAYSRFTIVNNKHKTLNIVPNFRYQLDAKYENGTKIYFMPDTPALTSNIEFDTLQKAIESFETDEQKLNIPAVDYTSLVEYYTICMAFGLVDSVQKNLNIKTWNIQPNTNIKDATFYISFYDMDTCLGINNVGSPVLYYAFSDYWPNTQSNNSTKLEPVDVFYDFSAKKIDSQNETSFYDIPSSYLFAIAKYAYVIYERTKKEVEQKGDNSFTIPNEINRSPNNVWAIWRHSTNSKYTEALSEDDRIFYRGEGSLRNADYFITTYYKNHLDNVPLPAFTMNYCYKYLVYSNETEAQTQNRVGFNSINCSMLWGRKLAYTRNWLNNRFHLLDAYFNLTKLGDLMKKADGSSTNVLIPHSDGQYDDKQNPDIYVYNDAFTPDNTPARFSKNITINIQAVPYSAILPIVSTSSAGRYIYPNDTLNKYTLTLNINNQEASFPGSQMFTYVDDIAQFINTGSNGNGQLYVKSNYLTELIAATHERKCSTWQLTVPMIRIFDFQSSQYSGDVSFNKDNLQLQTIKISKSSINLNCNNTDTLQCVEALSANGIGIQITNITPSALLNTVKLNGTFNKILMPAWSDNIKLPTETTEKLNYLNCPNIEITNEYYDNASISVTNNSSLTDLTLTGFKKIYISNCPKLSSLNINDSDDKDSQKLQEISVIFTRDNKPSVFNLNKNPTDDNNIINFTKLKSINCIKFNYAPSEKIIFNASTNSDIQLKSSALANCFNLKTFAIPTNGKKIKICGDAVFSGCGIFNLSCFTVNNTTKDCLCIDNNLTSLASMFNLTNRLGATVSTANTRGLNLAEAKYFLECCYKVNNGVNSKITNIGSLFANQSGITYPLTTVLQDQNSNTKNQLQLKFPNVTAATYVFYGTNVKSFGKYSLSGLGANRSTITLSHFANGSISATTDFLMPVVNKLNTFDFGSYESPLNTNNHSGYATYTFVNAKTSSPYYEQIPIVDLSSIFIGKDINNQTKTPDKLTAIYSLNIPNQYVNLSGIFDNSANWTAANSSGLNIALFGASNGNNNNNLTNANGAQLRVFIQDGWHDDTTNSCNAFQTFLQNVKVKSIVTSFKNVRFFRHKYDVEQLAYTNEIEDCTDETFIDIGLFINWNKIDNATNLFCNPINYYSSLNFNKKINYSKTIEISIYAEVPTSLLINGTNPKENNWYEKSGNSYNQTNDIEIEKIGTENIKTYYQLNKTLSAFSFIDLWDKVAENNTLTAMSYMFNKTKILVNEDSCIDNIKFITPDVTTYDPNDEEQFINNVYSNGCISSLNSPDCSTNNTTLKNIQYLFSGMRFVDNVTTSESKYVTFTSDFFKCFSAINNVQETFRNIYLANTLPYNFFNKHRLNTQTENVYVNVNIPKIDIITDEDTGVSTPVETTTIERHPVKLVTNEWNTDLSNMQNCFADIIFKQNIGFNPDASYNTFKYSNNTLISTDSNGHEIELTCTNYYSTNNITDSSGGVVPKLFATSDCNITTNYSNAHGELQNFKLIDESNYKTIDGNQCDSDTLANLLFLNKTFIAPDILYGVTSDCIVTGLFANTLDNNLTIAKRGLGDNYTEECRSYVSTYSSNKPVFTGALPQHMLMNLNSNSVKLTNIFLNLNILPTYIGTFYTIAAERQIKINDNYQTKDFYLPHESYVFIPESFSQQLQLENAFNFKIFIPANTQVKLPTSSEVSTTDGSNTINNIPEFEYNENTRIITNKGTAIDYYIMLQNSINKNTSTLKNGLPTNGCEKLYQYKDASDNNKIYAIPFNIRDYLTGYYACGHSSKIEVIYNNGEESNLPTIVLGFDVNYFNSMKFDNMLTDNLTRILNGEFFKNGTSVNNINIDTSEVIQLDLGGQINKNFVLPFSINANSNYIIGNLINKNSATNSGIGSESYPGNSIRIHQKSIQDLQNANLNSHSSLLTKYREYGIKIIDGTVNTYKPSYSRW